MNALEIYKLELTIKTEDPRENTHQGSQELKPETLSNH